MGKWVHRLSHVDAENLTAICAHCGPVRIVNKGYSRHAGRQKLYACSKGSYKWKAAYAERPTRKRLKVKTRLREFPDYEPPRSGICPLCDDEAKLFFDHCHLTGRYRDHICGRCNTMLGFSRDNPRVLRLAADYLEKHRSPQSED